jgi:hypothetical protein
MQTQAERRRLDDTFESAMRDFANLQRSITTEWIRAAYEAGNAIVEFQKLGLETNIQLLETTSEAARRVTDIWLSTLQETQQTLGRASRKAERLAVRTERRLEPMVERVTREADQVAEQAQAAASAAARTEPESPDRPAINVVKREDDWAIIRENASRATGVFDNKREAVARARELAKHQDAELNVEPSKQSQPARGRQGG